ncbi:uncharacterized protein I206_107599 [Kwoniella pini CBS 10737]|uniref:F-box domain-containing protein n=1 Tax=Kwoniella pini CBS 10737 TaxID=1296096 RepID=A0A1B9HXR0_9TREE|nr:uncharacterized protein I206_05932 [Kwoniella pini CBS 10737]OCF48065.1 hypothetical protein I206_05932 [Kwoniella pini CBS 10737]
MSMLDRLRMRRASFKDSPSSTPSSSSSSSTTTSPGSGTYFTPNKVPLPYENPDKNGINWLFALPDELLERVFVGLDRITISRSFRVCKRINELLNNSIPISLSYTLQCNSLKLNPYSLLPLIEKPSHIPPSKAQLLYTLKERLTRLRNFKAKSKNSVKFKESEGRLYEYLEGVLLRNVPPSDDFVHTGRAIGKEVAVYELGKGNEWEDINETITDESSFQQNDIPVEVEESEADEYFEEDQLVNDIRKTHKFDFDMQDFAVDPGQDLFVVAEVRHPAHRQFSLHLHLLTLSTFQPHPKAAKHILDWPVNLVTRISSLGFQICDDGLYVLRNNNGGAKDHLVGWQWTTGRMAVTLKPPAVATFESFILLTPTSFLIPSVRTRLQPNSVIQDDLADPRDLLFSHHLHIYAFPPFSSTQPKEGESIPPAHTPTQIAIIDLPEFEIDLEEDLPPPRLTIRTDPPPRHTFPQYPIENIQQFVPDPTSGIIIIEFYCQPLQNHTKPHFVLFSLKKTFAAYLPAPTSPLLLQAFPRPAPVIKWESIAPKVRFIGPDEPEPSWVCYVYGSRYVSPYPHESDMSTSIRLYDFDPLRVRKELYSRKNSGFVGVEPQSPRGIVKRLMFGLSTSTTPLSSPGKSTTNKEETKYDGDKDGIHLITEETILKKKSPLKYEIKTGKELPFIFSENKVDGLVETVVLDGERLIIFDYQNDEEIMEILDF